MFQRDIFKTAHTTEQIVYSFEFIQIFSTVISFFGNIDRNFCGSNLNTCANRKIIKRYVNMNGKAVKNDFHLPRNMSSKYARIIELIQDSNISKSSHWFILLHKFSLHIPLFNFYIFLTYNFLFLIRLQNVLFFCRTINNSHHFTKSNFSNSSCTWNILHASSSSRLLIFLLYWCSWI